MLQEISALFFPRLHDQAHFHSVCPNTYYSVWLQQKEREMILSLFFLWSERASEAEWQPNYHTITMAIYSKSLMKLLWVDKRASHLRSAEMEDQTVRLDAALVTWSEVFGCEEGWDGL